MPGLEALEPGVRKTVDLGQPRRRSFHLRQRDGAVQPDDHIVARRQHRIVERQHFRPGHRVGQAAPCAPDAMDGRIQRPRPIGAEIAGAVQEGVGFHDEAARPERRVLLRKRDHQPVPAGSCRPARFGVADQGGQTQHLALAGQHLGQGAGQLQHLGGEAGIGA